MPDKKPPKTISEALKPPKRQPVTSFDRSALKAYNAGQSLRSDGERLPYQEPEPTGQKGPPRSFSELFNPGRFTVDTRNGTLAAPDRAPVRSKGFATYGADFTEAPLGAGLGFGPAAENTPAFAAQRIERPDSDGAGPMTSVRSAHGYQIMQDSNPTPAPATAGPQMGPTGSVFARFAKTPADRQATAAMEANLPARTYSRGVLSTMKEEADRPKAMALYQQSLRMPRTVGEAVRMAINGGDLETAQEAASIGAEMVARGEHSPRNERALADRTWEKFHLRQQAQESVRRDRENERRGQAQARQSSSRGAGGYPGFLGMPGVGRGSVNGQDALYPIAGQADAYRASMDSLGLPDDEIAVGVDVQGLRDRYQTNLTRLPSSELAKLTAANPNNPLYAKAYREALTREAEDAAVQGGLKHRRALELAAANHPDTSKPKSQPGLKKWQAEDIELGKKIDELEGLTRGLTPDDDATWRGKEYSVGELRTMLHEMQGRRKGGYGAWAQRRRDAGDPEFMGQQTGAGSSSRGSQSAGSESVPQSPHVRADQVEALRGLTQVQLDRIRRDAEGNGPNAAYARGVLQVYHQLHGIR